MNIRPLGKNILIEYEAPPSQTDGGILLTADTQGKSSYARVLAVGPHPEIEVAVGERVYVSNFGGTELMRDGKEFRLVTMKELLASTSRPDYQTFKKASDDLERDCSFDAKYNARFTNESDRKKTPEEIEAMRGINNPDHAIHGPKGMKDQILFPRTRAV